MKKLLSIGLLVFAIGCGGVQYEDANEAEGTRQFGAKEIKGTVTVMVKSLYTYLKEDWKKPAFIQFKKFQNKTSEHIDTEMIANEIRTKLIKQRIKFIDDSLDAEALAEMEKGQTGLIDPDSAIPSGEMKSPNFYLTGDIRENVGYVDGKKKQLLVVTLSLLNIKTRETLWSEQKEFYKSMSDEVSF